jgi:AcrR family transcriptional regulator
VSAETTVTAEVARKTRPANRRQQILAAAAELFGTRGYEYVGMSDIADAVRVRPSALYRHFAGKESLLNQILDQSVAELEAVLAASDLTTAAGLRELTCYAVESRHVAALLQRDLPHLSEASRRQVRARLRRVGVLVAERISAARPEVTTHAADLLAQAVLAVLQSPAFYPLQRREEVSGELAVLVERVVSASVPAPFGGMRVAETGSGLLPVSRREALLARAIALFAERTYAGVRVEDVAASLDIAGPSVYNHFASKSDILVTALERGAAYLAVQAADTLATATSPAAALREFLSGYGRFGLAHPALIDLMMSETRSLPEPARGAVLEAERNYVAELVHLLRQVHPDLTQAAARVQVQAALMIANDVARTARLRTLAGAAEAVADVCVQALALPGLGGGLGGRSGRWVGMVPGVISRDS